MPAGRLKGQASHNKVGVQKNRFIAIAEETYEIVSAISFYENISMKEVVKRAMSNYEFSMKKGGEDGSAIFYNERR